MKLNNTAVILCGVVALIFTIIIWSIMMPKDVLTPKVIIPSVTQKVTLVNDYDKLVLESHWLEDNEEGLKTNITKLKDNPYSEEKTVYRLKTSLGEENDSYVYGSQIYIEGKRCEEYNKMLEVRKGLVELNKPIMCKSK